MAAIRAAFPRRPLAVAVPGRGWRGLRSNLFVAIVLVVVWQQAVSDNLPLLLTDSMLALSGQAVPMPEQYLGPGSRCWADARIVTNCELHLRARAEGGLWQSRTVSYAHFFGRPDPGELFVVGLPAEPYWLTTDHALSRLANRLLVFALTIGGIAGFVAWWLRGRVRAWRARRRIGRALSGQVLVPVLLRAATGHDAPAMLSYGRPRFRFAPLPSGEMPSWEPSFGGPLFPLAQRGSEPPSILLGVTAPGSGVVMPLDRAGRWIGLTEEERQRLWRAAGLPAEA